MAKGSVRKKGKKWYYRFYVEDASGNLVQKECVGTESKVKLKNYRNGCMRKAMLPSCGKSHSRTTFDVWEEGMVGSAKNGC